MNFFSTEFIVIVGGLITAFCWGIGDIPLKKALDEGKSGNVNIYFMLGQAIMNLPLFFIIPIVGEINLTIILLALLFSFIDFVYFLLIIQAFKYTKASIVNPILSTFPVFTLISSVLFFGEEFRPITTILIMTIIIGIGLISVKLSDIRSDGFQPSDLGIGAIIAVIAVIIAGANVPFLDSFISENNNAVVITIVRTALVGFTFLFYKLFYKSELDSLVPKSNEYLSLFSGLIQGTGLLIFTFSLLILESSTLITAVSSIFPVFLVIGSRVVLKEKLELNQYIGISVVVITVFLLNLRI